MAREHPAFVDGYILRRRLQEQSWEEKKYLPARCPLERRISGSVGAWTSSRNSAALTQSQLAKKSQGQPHPTAKRQYIGQQSIPSKQSPHEPLLEKHYRFSSVPAATSIKASERHTTSTGRNVVRKQTTSSQSRSPSSTRRGFRKIRKGYPSKLSSYSYSQGLTWKKVSLADQSSTSASSTAQSAHLSSNVTLPRVGQKSSKIRTFHGIDERKRRHKQCSSLSISENPTGTNHCTEHSGSTSPCVCGEKECDNYGHHKRSASVDRTVGVAKLWGYVGMKGWRGGECCCEDTGEELGTSVMGDTLSIEDATDESLLEEGGSEEGDDGGNGFSEQDLTDLEDEASKCSPVDDSSTLEMPFETGMDPITYTLLVKASQQLKQLSLNFESGTEESGADDGDKRSASTEPDLRIFKPKHTKHDQTKPKQQEQDKPTGQNVTVDDQCEYQLTSTSNGLCHKEVELELPTIFLTDSSIKDTEQVMKPVGPLLKKTHNPSLPSPPLTPSLFPGLQPTIHFPMPDEPFTLLPPSQRSLLKWKMSTITPNVIKHCIARAGFTHCNKGNGWLGYWGKHMRTQAFRAIGEHQKVNHFPGSFEIGRKDRLWRNLNRLQSRVGKNHLNFVPLTFVLPHDLRLLKREWGSGDHTKQKWILKPPAAARGIGVRVIHKWNQIPKKRPIVVQKYIADPFLINGNKFDLRVYVYVSSYDPLKIYVFQDGLARFATCKYSSSMRSLSNRYIHITNYSVNKKNIKFTQNPDETQCQGHKWGLLALWQYMSTELGLNTDAIWDSIKDLVIKTIICSESHCSSLIKAYLQNSYSCHELFGFDVMLDRKLKPWILEVNISPSLHSNSQLDINIKGQMVRDLLNIAGFKLPHTMDPPYHTLCGQHSTLTSEERRKHSHFLQRSLPEIERRKILEKLTAEDVAVLMQAEDEFSRRGMFERVFPSPYSSRYRKFFETEKYYNILLEQWLLKYHRSSSRGIDMLRRLAKENT